MGVYDSVEFNCPHCGTTLTEQSKAGRCELRTYKLDDVPYVIAVDLSDAVIRCNCGAKFKLRIHPVPIRVALEIIGDK